MKTESQFMVCTHNLVQGVAPTLCVLHAGASVAHPAHRRVLVRDKDDESGDALWARVRAEADAIEVLHEPFGTVGSIHFYYYLLEDLERLQGSTAHHNYRLALHWMMAADKPGDVRLWAATKLAQLIGMLPPVKKVRVK